MVSSNNAAACALTGHVEIPQYIKRYHPNSESVGFSKPPVKITMAINCVRTHDVKCRPRVAIDGAKTLNF